MQASQGLARGFTIRAMKKAQPKPQKKAPRKYVRPTVTEPQARTVNQRLAGRVAIVTGGSRGIGLAIAKELAAEGCRVVITGRDEAALASAAAYIAARGGEAMTRHCDVRDPKSVAALFTGVKAEFGRLDLLINNAGLAHPLADVQEFSLETWKEVIDTNLTGLFLTTHAALPLMKSGATIVNNLSMAAKTVFPGMSAYTASKHGAAGFTDSLREEVRKRGIRVISLVPGATDTRIWEQFWSEAPREKMMSPKTVADALLAALLLPENATVSELVITPTGGAL